MESSFEVIQFLARSENHLAVLAALTRGGLFTKSELQTETGISRSTVGRTLSEFESLELVSSDNHRYKATPLGKLFSQRLHSVFDSIEAMQRLQTLLGQIAVTVPHMTFTDAVGSEILTPTSFDPEGPTRRFVDRLHAALHVRMLVPRGIPVLLEEDAAISGSQTFEVVIPHDALGFATESLPSAQQRRNVIATGEMSVFTSNADIPYLAGTIDGITVVGQTDTAGEIQGYLETGDETVRSWAENTIDAYQQQAERVTN